jgi:hypothetical protein
MGFPIVLYQSIGVSHRLGPVDFPPCPDQPWISVSQVMGQRPKSSIFSSDFPMNNTNPAIGVSPKIASVTDRRWSNHEIIRHLRHNSLKTRPMGRHSEHGFPIPSVPRISRSRPEKNRPSSGPRRSCHPRSSLHSEVRTLHDMWWEWAVTQVPSMPLQTQITRQKLQTGCRKVCKNRLKNGAKWKLF